MSSAQSLKNQPDYNTLAIFREIRSNSHVDIEVTFMSAAFSNLQLCRVLIAILLCDIYTVALHRLARKLYISDQQEIAARHIEGKEFRATRIASLSDHGHTQPPHREFT